MTKVKIHDIEDVHGFVHSMIQRALPTAILTPEAREELMQTGMLLLQGMALKDKSQSGSGEHDEGSKFSGYASRFLPGKLRDAWHKQEGHTLRQGANGKREWVINDKPVSLERIMEERGSETGNGVDSIAQLQAGPYKPSPQEEKNQLAEQLGRVLDTQYAEQRLTTIGVALLIADGASHTQCAKELGITEREVTAAVARITSISPSLTGVQV